MLLRFAIIFLFFPIACKDPCEKSPDPNTSQTRLYLSIRSKTDSTDVIFGNKRIYYPDSLSAFVPPLGATAPKPVAIEVQDTFVVLSLPPVNQQLVLKYSPTEWDTLVIKASQKWSECNGGYITYDALQYNTVTTYAISYNGPFVIYH